MTICDAHVHFFSPDFFRALGASPDRVAGIGMEFPESAEALADRWVAELDKNGVSRCSLIASTANDAGSVSIAIARHPSRFVGFFMLDPTKPGWEAYATRALDAGHRTICLFPAMHQYSTKDPIVDEVFRLAAARPGTVVFVHCGELSVGIRGKLGLPNAFDPSLGNPSFLIRIVERHPEVPIIIPHLGGTMFEHARTLIDRPCQVYLDTSSSNSWLASTNKNLGFSDAINIVMSLMPTDRLLFGTDSSFFPRGWNRTIFDTQSEQISDWLFAELRPKMFAENFNRLFPSVKDGHD
jgi:predicted TIM-barrel fold metal-dependent hydrolase